MKNSRILKIYGVLVLLFYEKPMQEPRSLYGVVGEKNLPRSPRCWA